MTTKAGKLRGKLGSFAKEREEFEQKKKELEEQMHREKQNMGKIRRGLRGNDLNLETTDDDDEFHGKRVKSAKSMKNLHNDSNDQLLKAPPIPSGTKISDWCYVGSIDSSPPVIKSQELYEEVRFLGRGAYGTVDLVKNREDHKLYASKTLLLQHKSDEKGFFHEVKFLRQNRHPFIIHLHDVFMLSNPRKIFLIMHYCEGGDLGKVISMAAKNNQPLNENQVLKWISQVALALSFLHGNNIAHRDIKPVNILLSDSGEVAQLSDFGLATELNHPDRKESDQTAEVGTPYYTSPEMISNEPCTLATDCWSLGVCFFELLSLKLPFDGDTTVALVKSILQDQPDLSLIPANFYSPEIFVPLEGLLVKDPQTRMTINQFILTPPITGRVSLLPSQYRPKYLEERLRRYHTKQMTNQLDKLGILTNTPQQLQAKSLNSTPFDKKQLTHLSEDEEDKLSSRGTSRCTTRDRATLDSARPSEQGQDILLSVDIAEIVEDESKGIVLDDPMDDPNIRNPLSLKEETLIVEPKDGNKSPILPALLTLHHNSTSKDKETTTSSTKSGVTSSISSSEVNTPISINMKSVRMISTSDKSHDSHHTHQSDDGTGTMTKHSHIGPIELASNYLKKHLQTHQYSDDLDHIVSSPNPIERELPPIISPRILTSIAPSPNAISTSSSLNTLPSHSNRNNIHITPLDSSSSSSSILQHHNPHHPHSHYHRVKTPETSVSLPELSFPSSITSLPPLVKYDNSSSNSNTGNDPRPISSDGSLKSGRKEKKMKSERNCINDVQLTSTTSTSTTPTVITPSDVSSEIFQGNEAINGNDGHENILLTSEEINNNLVEESMATTLVESSADGVRLEEEV